MKFEIKNRFTGAVQFAAEIEADKNTPRSIKIGLAVKWAIKTRANLADAYLADAYLAGANLADAYLAGANLAGAYLAGAYLADANLADANLAGAYLAGANLADANLAGAYLADANLADAYLAGANLAGANLAGANLAGANLAGANLAGANLADANLAGVKWCDGITINKQPIQVYGLRYKVAILDSHMQIGCELHRLCEWESFSDDRINQMDGRDALRFWRAHKDVLLAVARSGERDFSDAEAEAVKS